MFCKNRVFLHVITVLSLLAVTGGSLYACYNPYLMAILDSDQSSVWVGMPVIFDGSGSYGGESDEIVKYEWDFNYEGTFECDYVETSSNPPDGDFDGMVTYIYDTPGTYTVMLKITDDSGYTDTDTCEVDIQDPDQAVRYYVNGNINIGSDSYDGLAAEPDGPYHGPKKTIQAGIEVIADADIDMAVLEVASGSYQENISFDTNGKVILMTSTDPDNWDVVEDTVIQGNDTVPVVTFEGDEYPSCILRGFTITGGYGPGSIDDPRRGGGICGQVTHATISKCIIEGNLCEKTGGGIQSCQGTINNCFIRGNTSKTSGGGLADCQGKIINCVIAGNLATAENNSDGGGALHNCNGSIINCTIANNIGDKCGALRYCADAEIVNCIIRGNSEPAFYLCEGLLPTYSCLPVGECAQEVISHWKFDGNADDSVENNDGEVHGAQWTSSGKVEGALIFDGDGDYVDLGEDNSLKPAFPIAISAWINLSSGGADTVRRIISLDDQSTHYYGLWLQVMSGNTINIAYGDGGSPEYSSRRTKIGTTVLEANIWYYIAAVISGPTDMDLYINGSYDDGTYAGSGGTIVYSGGSSFIGSRGDILNFFHGRIDEVGLYRRSLSASEVQELYDEGLAERSYWVESNISDDPLFIAPGQWDDNGTPDNIIDDTWIDNGDYHLWYYSPCNDAGNPYANYAGQTDIGGAPREGGDMVDMGAYEWPLNESPFPYLTSFEENQGFYDADDDEDMTVIDDMEDWSVSEGGAADVTEIYYYTTDGEKTISTPYQYLRIEDYSSGDNITVTRELEANSNRYIRISCIPSIGSYINILNDNSEKVASIWFKQEDNPEDNCIHVWNNGSYQSTNVAYYDVVEQCDTFLGNITPELEGYSYENTWIEFKICLDWTNQTYDVSWRHWDCTGGEPIITGAQFDATYQDYAKVEFVADRSGTDDLHTTFRLNRLSVSDEIGNGGVFGREDDVWITYPRADMDRPLKGSYPIIGTVWYEKLGEYKIKCCPIDLDTEESDNWIVVDCGFSTKKSAVLGCLDTLAFNNGDYYLKMEIYDDIGQLCESACGIITKERTFNGATKEVKVEYPVIGRTKGKTYHHEENPDVSVNWPGSFPFEFRRIYDDNLRNRLYPLYFGWTHNHNIRIIESTTYDWIKDEQGNPLGDSNKLGIGKLWLQKALGCRMFVGQPPSPDAPGQVIYLPVDNKQDYIVRTTAPISTEPPTFNITYDHYATNGMKMIFEKQQFVLDSPSNLESLPADEGAVDWMLIKGIDRMEDRFGNALNYTWEDTSELYITEIANNRNSIKLKLEYNLHAFGDYGPMVCSNIKLLKESSAPYEIVTFYASGSVMLDPSGSVYEDRLHAVYKICQGGSRFTTEMSYIIEEAKGVSLTALGAPIISGAILEMSMYHGFTHNINGTLKEEMLWSNSGSGYCLFKTYDYQYDSSGCLNTNAKYKVLDVTNRSITGALSTHNYCVLIKSRQTQTNPEGAILKINTQVHNAECNGEIFNPDTYKDPPDAENYIALSDFGRYLRKYGSYSGCGATRDLEYFYEDDLFPLKPTTMIEYFDNDPNCECESDGPERKTTFKYDDSGNLIERRVYINEVNFVLAQYEYHTFYNFMTCQTTWKGYCSQQGDDVITTGAKVQKQWIYGNADGETTGIEPEDRKYLVQEKTLLDDKGTEDPDDDEWAMVTNYKYYSNNPNNGQVKIKEVPYDTDQNNINYYEYDGRGFLVKEWNGTDIEPTTGEPIGPPQKRYYYNEAGLKELEADYLGKVSMYIYDDNARVEELRVYHDDWTVMTSDNFVPGMYDNDPYHGDDGEKFQSKTEYNLSHGYFLYKDITLPTGGVLHKDYIGADDKSLVDYYYGEDNLDWDGHISISNAPDDFRPLCLWQRIEQGYIEKHSVYDSVNRLAHIYEYNYNCCELPDNPYVKHSEYGYYGSGKKSYEKIYRVDRTGNNTFADPVLEKHTTYNYDILDRLTMKVEDPDGLLPITVQYGYDALGTRLYVVNPEGNVIFTDYDNANRKTYEYFAAVPVYYSGTENIDFELTKSNNAVVKKEYQYYTNNKIKAETSYDYDGATLSCTEYAYDSRGRVQEVKQAVADSNQNQQIEENEKAITTYEYHDVGIPGPLENDPNVYHIIITDAEEVAGEENYTWISLNPDGKTRKIVYPSEDYVLTEYYEYGLPRLKFIWDSVSGTRHAIRYEYNEYGKLKKVIYPDEPVNGYLEYEYTKGTLKGFGKVKTITDSRNAPDRPGDAGSTYKFEYNMWSGNMLSHTNYDGYTINYDYNTAYNQVKSINVKEPVAQDVIYSVDYSYNLAGQLGLVKESGNDIAGFTYDDNGNRDLLTYNLSNPISVDYGYDLDNRLISIESKQLNYPETVYYEFDADTAGYIDGLGRLVDGDETITKTDNSPVTHSLDYSYDMLSQLTGATITNIGGSTWTAGYNYYKDGNLDTRDINGTVNDFGYDGDLLTGVDTDTLDWDLNGNLTDGITTSMEWNWDNKLRSATVGSDSISCKYAPDGSMVYKESTQNSQTVKRKFIVDIVGRYPVILMELDPTNNNNIEKTYVHANGQVLMQHDGDTSANKFFYLHDRLGSVRQLIGTDGAVENHYTYDPFGQAFASETDETIENRFCFAGYKWDNTTGMYNCNARWYDPAIYRFTGRDPVKGKFREPMTLHTYLYCLNDPVNRIDPSGEISATSLTSGVITGYALYGHGISLAIYAAWTGDDRFWKLSELTFNIIPLAIGLASLNPYGPATNLATAIGVHFNQIAYGSTTGMSRAQALAVDPLAFLLYRGVMGTAHKYIGTDENDMQNFIDWMGVDWLGD